MADQLNLDQFNDGLRDSVDSLNAFNSGVLNNTNSIVSLNDANRQASAILQQEEAAKKEFKQALKKNTHAMVNTIGELGASLASGNNKFAVFNGVINATSKAIGRLTDAVSKLDSKYAAILGKAAKHFTGASAEISKVLIREFQTGWDSYVKLTDTGLVDSFTHLKNISQQTNLRFEALASTLPKYSKTISTLNSSALLGKSGFEDLAKDGTDLRKQFRARGINDQEFIQYQLAYIDQQTRLGLIQNRDVRDINTGTAKYIEELDAQAKLLGISRTEQQQAREVALSANNFRAAISQLSREISDPQKLRMIAERATNFSAILEKQLPSAAAGIRDLFSANGKATTDAAKRLFEQTDGQAAEIAVRLRRGEIDENQARNMLIKSMEKYNKRFAQQVQFNDKILGAQDFAARQDFIEGKIRTKQEVEASRKNLAATDKLTTDLATATYNLDTASRNLQDTATSFESVTASLRIMTDVINSVTDLADKFVSDSSTTSGSSTTPTTPATVVPAAPSTGRRPTIGGVPTTRGISVGRTTEEKIADLYDKITNKTIVDEIRGKVSSGRITSEQALEQLSQAYAAQPTSGRPASLQKIRDFIGKYESRGDYNILVGGRRAKLTEMTLDQIAELQKSMLSSGNFKSSAVGKYQIIKSTLEQLRSQLKLSGSVKFDEKLQDQLADQLIKRRGYQQYVDGKLSIDRFANKLAAEWASLPLESGRGRYDNQNSNKSLVSRPEFIAALQARNGGIFKGPSTGYTVELSGDKAVIPANDGVTKQALNTASIGNPDGDIGLLRQLNDILSEKFDNMIELLTDSDNYQSRLLRSMI